MLANILRVATGDVGVTLSGFFGALLAIFGDGEIWIMVIALLILNLLLGIVVSILNIRKLRRK